MKLRIDVVSCAGSPVQTEEFELSRHAEDVLTTVNSMTTGKVQVTVVVEHLVAVNDVPAGKVPRRL